MNRFLILAGIFIALAALAPSQLGKLANQQPAADGVPAGDAQMARTSDKAGDKAGDASANEQIGHSARISPGRGGHFFTEARMNGRSVDVLVDTGATLVAINESTARRLGIRLTPADFKYRVHTANGDTEAAAATIDEIRIGRVTVRDVPATVSRNSALSGTLLGMSFLGKLRKFSVEGGDLILSE